MRFELDPNVEALYVRMHEGGVAETFELGEDVYLDVDGRVLGAEFAEAGDCLARLRSRDGRLQIRSTSTSAQPDAP